MVKETTSVLAIDWLTLELQLAVLLVTIASFLAGPWGVARQQISWLSTIGSWGKRLASLVLRWGERFVVAGLEQLWDVLFLLLFLSNVLWYAFVPFHSWAGYGPRYYYASFFALALLGARGAMALLNRLKRRWPAGEGVGLAAASLGICSALSLFWVLPVKLADAHRSIVARQALYQMIDRTQLDNAIVFIRYVSGDFQPWNLTRNPLDFRG